MTRVAAALGALLLLAAPAPAHRLAPALLSLEESADGSIALRFKAPRRNPGGVALAPRLPPGCHADAPRVERDETSIVWNARLDCGEQGLVGRRLAVSGLAESGSNAIVRVALGDGRRLQAVLHAGAPHFEVARRSAPLRVLGDYGVLGFEHIVTGLDHLLFVFGLLLLVRGLRELALTVTAFTLGHSITLSLAVLGVVRLPTSPIELAIAVTLLVLALELARDGGPSPLGRRPWAMAAGFGLLHGLGFAGALAEIGLPQEEIPGALLGFNLGIEAGQLGFVAAVEALRTALARLPLAPPGWLRRAPVTCLGALAAYWCLERGAALF